MSAETRPPVLSDDAPRGMSHEDQAAAIGVHPDELLSWKALAELPGEVFEAALRSSMSTFHEAHSCLVLLEAKRLAPILARKHVQRGLAAYGGMTPDERRAFVLATGADRLEDA